MSVEQPIRFSLSVVYTCISLGISIHKKIASILTCSITLTISIIANPNNFSHTLEEETLAFSHLKPLNYRIAKNLNCDTFLDLKILNS